MRAKIIDISFWQGMINWAQVVSDGVNGVIIKSSEADYIDKKFMSYWQEAKGVGLPRSTYHFYRERCWGAQQAQLVVDTLDKAGWGEWHAWLDFEIKAGAVTAQNLARGVKDYLDEFERLTNQRPGIRPSVKRGGVYTSQGSWWPLAFFASWAPDYDLWSAQYPWENDKLFVQRFSERSHIVYETEYALPTVKPWTKPFIWQWTGHGRVAGISGDVDMNVFDGTKEEFYRAIGFQQAGQSLPITDAEKLSTLWEAHPELHK